MADRTPCPTANFALVIVRRKETRNRGWWIPGGRVEHGEDFASAALRETKEEAGVDINLGGVLRVEHTPSQAKSARLRVIFFGTPKNEKQAPKSKADEESEEARYVTLTEFKHLIEVQKEKLRSSEPYTWFEYMEKEGAVYPMVVLAAEWDAVPTPGIAPAAAGVK